ncbi:MAG TPA: di-heme oxidoredictase family protein [Vicinamibacterales bacterium]|jgi:CxxC motif-containing protein (DUF1111 family)
MRNAFSVGVCLGAAALAAAITFNDRVLSQQNGEGLSARAETALAGTTATVTAIPVTEAPTGFDGKSNGYAEEYCSSQSALSHTTASPDIPDTECSYDSAVEEFGGHEEDSDGIGPVYNARGCGECHGAPILGGSSQVVERRAGFFSFNTGFVDHPGGSLIHDRAIDPSIQETVDPRANVIALRASQSVLGDGFVEAIGSPTLAQIAAQQPFSMRGQLINVAVFEQPGATRTGRFGWKNQQASLLSFSADAYLNEMGITSPMQPTENTSNGADVSAFDNVPLGHGSDLDNKGVDTELFALFMRSTKAPPVDATRAATAGAVAGSTIFNQLGCNTCHTRTIVTDPPGTVINGGALIIANAVGSKRIHPFGDYLLHDIGTGDGIVQNGGQSTRNKVRTAPLWGLRTRGRFMHDMESHNVEDAIDRHGNQAAGTRSAYHALSNRDKARLVAFLKSL